MEATCKGNTKIISKEWKCTAQAYEVSENTNLTTLVEKLCFPVMVKPCDGSGSRGVSRVDEMSQFADACQKAIPQAYSKA